METTTDEIVARISAVRKCARRARFNEESVDDIAQDAALLCLKNKFDKQRPYQTFIDVLRGGGEGTYSRAGYPTRDVVANEAGQIQLEGLRFEPDFENSEEYRSNVYDIVSHLRFLREREQRIIILHYQYEWTLAEISHFERVSESRISQQLNSALIILKKEIVSSRLSQDKQRERKLKEFSAVLQHENRPGMGRQKKSKMARICENEGFRVGSFEIAEIPEILCASF